MTARRDEVNVRTVKDVRNLRKCELCGGFGDARRMLTVNGQRAHGSCVVETMPAAWVLNLPAAERNKLTLRDVGPDLMRALMAKYDEDDK